MAKTANFLEFHDAANLFPIDDETIDELIEDIRSNGLLVPIELLDGKILDGRRRYMACRRADVEPQFRKVNPDDPVAYAISLNLHRRHLSESQRGMIGARAHGFYEKQAKERQQARKGKQAGATVENLPQLDSGTARDKAGKAVGVSGKTVDYGRRVLEQGTPELIAAVDADKVSVSTAARMVPKSPEEQNKWLETATKTDRKNARANRVISEEPEEENGKPRGVGVIRANEAINCLIRIPKNDRLRKRGFQIVTDWIKANQ